MIPKILAILVGIFFITGAGHFEKSVKLIGTAEYYLNHSEISYVWGGNTVGGKKACEACSRCLNDKKPAKTKKLAACPSCQKCGLDCSHFILHVFKNAGLQTNYLTTAAMRSFSKKRLLNDFNWVDLGAKASRAMPGDLAVYPGHVVMVMKVDANNNSADIIHVTSGRDIKKAGEAVQAEHGVNIQNFRGPLQRLLRHKDIYAEYRSKGRFWRVEPVVKKDYE